MHEYDPLFFLFPYTTISEVDGLTLPLVFPSLSPLQVSRPFGVPTSCRGFLRPWAAFDEDEDAALVAGKLRDYEEFGALHGEESLQSSMARQWALKLLDEDARRIRSALKGGSVDTALQERKRLVTEAGLFLELARDLDEKELELQRDYRKMDALEEDFRRILGMDEEDGLEEMVETLNLSLRNERSHLSFLLPRRIAFWFRLVLPRLKHCPAAFVTGEREVIDTLSEAAATICAQRGLESDVEEILLPPMRFPPSRFEKNAECFHAAGDLAQAGALRTAVEELVRHAGSDESWSAGISRVQAAWKALNDAWDPRPSGAASGVFQLSLVRFRNTSAEDLWSFWDKKGREILGGPENCGAFRPIFFLYRFEGF